MHIYTKVGNVLWFKQELWGDEIPSMAQQDSTKLYT